MQLVCLPHGIWRVHNMRPGLSPIRSAAKYYLAILLQAARPERARAMSKFLEWIFSDGEKLAQSYGYMELPAPLLARVRSRFNRYVEQ